jgi:hypothetical protein
MYRVGIGWGAFGKKEYLILLGREADCQAKYFIVNESGKLYNR